LKSLKEQLGGLVYSTDQGDMCQQCAMPVKKCQCSANAQLQRISQLDGIVSISRETKGRKGKGVTLIRGLALNDKELKLLAKSMKQKCGTGGAVKDGVIEIQGDQRQILKMYLEQQKYTVKLAGG